MNRFQTSELLKSVAQYPVAKGDVQGHAFHGNQWSKAAPGDAEGTGLVGYVHTSRADVERAFGKPDYDTSHDNRGGDDYLEKVTHEWTVKTPTGRVATVYDWKDPNPPQSGNEGNYQYHVGGNDTTVLSEVGRVLGARTTSA